MHAIHQGIVIITTELAADGFIFFEQCGQFTQSLCHDIKHLMGRIERRLLFHIGNAQVLLHDQQSVIQFGRARDDFEQ